MSWVLREIVSYSWDSFFFSFKKTRLLIKVDDEYIIKIIAMTIHSFKFWQTFFLLRQQSGRVKRHAYSYVFLLRPPLPKARSRGGRQFFCVSKLKVKYSLLLSKKIYFEDFHVGKLKVKTLFSFKSESLENSNLFSFFTVVLRVCFFNFF